MPLQQTSGAASYDAFGGGVPVVPKYIEDAFSCFLYSGTSANQIITNGINLSTDGGLVWIKRRSSVTAHALFDTNRGVQKYLQSNTTDAEGTASTSLTAFFTDGFRVGADSLVNEAGETYVSWTLKQQPKFFDVVTYTGNGTTQNIAHNLAGTVGCLIVKRTDTGGTNWMVYHRSLPTNDALALNTTQASNEYFTPTIFGNNTVSVAPTSTQFTVGNFSAVNASGGTYVAYLFAHNAGGFGLTGTDNVISCGSYTGNGSTSGPVINLGYEPQWLMVKNASDVANWILVDTMRGASQTGSRRLNPNLSGAESGSSNSDCAPLATGFQVRDDGGSVNASGNTYIYIAIRRGPMRTPTTGTSVFAPVTQTAAGTVTTGFPVDLAISGSRTSTGSKLSLDRLRGSSTNSYASLFTNSNGVEGTGTGSGFGFDNNTGYVDAFWSTSSMAYWNFRRAPGFFDEICFTVSGSVPLAHNLGVTPELVIYKTRNAADSWWTCANLNGVGQINNTGAWALTGLGNGLTAVAQATSTTISNLNGVLLSNGNTVVAYLFASCPGVSRVGSFTGTGATQVINCGFTGGARFVLIKATSTTGDWYVWDSARGIVAGNDPYLELNTTDAEVTNTDWVDTAATGFELSNAGGNLANSNGVSYIYLAIA